MTKLTDAELTAVEHALDRPARPDLSKDEVRRMLVEIREHRARPILTPTEINAVRSATRGAPRDGDLTESAFRKMAGFGGDVCAAGPAFSDVEALRGLAAAEVESKEPLIDVTTAAIDAINVERDRLCVEALRLSQALVAAYTEIHSVTAERDYLRAENDRLKKIRNTMFGEGYDQAVEEIRDHFAKRENTEVIAEIDLIWRKDKLP